MKKIVTLILLFGLSACSRAFNDADDGVTAAERYPIAVNPDVATLELVVQPGQKALSYEDSAAVDAFIGEFKMRGHSLMNIALPSGSANASASKTAARQIQDMMYRRGLSNAYVDGSTYSSDPGTGAAPIVMSFNKALWIQPVLIFDPAAAAAHNIRTILLKGVYGFF